MSILPRVFILGNSNIGFRIAHESIRRGWGVTVTSRTPNLRHSKIEYVHTPEHLMTNVAYWKNLAARHIQEPSIIVNTNGGSIHDKGGSLRDLNVTIPVASMKGINEHLRTTKLVNHCFVQLSTIAANGIEAEYGKTKREAEIALMNLPIPHITIFRVGDVIAPKFIDNATDIIKAQHQFSAEELALLPITFLIGDQPNRVLVPSIHVDDLAKGVCNVFHFPNGKRMMNAVNSEVLTQEEYFKFFRDLYGKSYRPFYIPIDAAKRLVKHYPIGHFAPYAIEFCEKESQVSDNREFQKLIGTRLRTLSESYKLNPDQKLLAPLPTIGTYALSAMRKLFQSSQARTDTFHALKLMARSCFKIKGKPLARLTDKVDYRILSEKKFNAHAQKNRTSF